VAREVLQAIARPRLFGTAGAVHVARLLRERLEAAGLTVEVQGFRFSTWPGRWGVPALGLLLTLVFTIAGLHAAAGNATMAATTLAVTLLLLVPLPFLAGPAVDGLPIGRAAGRNIVASRQGATPRFLIVAHRDSKSQPVPLGLRIAAVALSLVAIPATMFSALLGSGALATACAIAGAASSVVLVFCGTGNRSPGALDNATGLVALLELAAHETAGDVGFLVTDAEELGLAGARSAAARSGCDVEAVINLDGLDDGGPIRLLTGRGPGARQRAVRLEAALADAARARGLEVRAHHVPAGLMVDHLPFASAGLPAITVMRGHARSLARVHRAADSLDRVSGSGALLVAEVVSAALENLRQSSLAPAP
jgi:hypothetical protein